MKTINDIKRSYGFTLIELLIVLLVIGILLAIAIPSYHSYLERTRRTDAKSALLETAGLMEQYFLQHNAYIADLSSVGARTQTEDGTYQITATVPSADGTAAYALTAAPIGQQTGDTCGSFTYNALGVKGVTGTETVAHCW